MFKEKDALTIRLCAMEKIRLAKSVPNINSSLFSRDEVFLMLSQCLNSKVHFISDTVMRLYDMETLTGNNSNNKLHNFHLAKHYLVRVV